MARKVRLSIASSSTTRMRATVDPLPGSFVPDWPTAAEARLASGAEIGVRGLHASDSSRRRRRLPNPDTPPQQPIGEILTRCAFQDALPQAAEAAPRLQ